MRSDAPLAGKVAIVTGASKRLGRCYALALASAGASVVAVARSLGDDPSKVGTLVEVEATARARGHDVTAYRCDLSDETAIEQMVEDVAASHGGIDVVLNNAVAPMERLNCLTVPLDVWEEQMRINVRAPYVLMALASQSMKSRGGGSIINITSLAAETTGKGGGAHAGLVHYGVSKAALNRLTSYFAAEFEEENIAVNSLSPGDAATYLLLVNGLNPGANPDDRVVSGRQLDEDFWGRPAIYLAGVRPRDVTGKTLHTYTFGESWGPHYETEPDWSPEILELLGRNNVLPGSRRID